VKRTFSSYTLIRPFPKGRDMKAPFILSVLLTLALSACGTVQGSKECAPDPAAENWVVWPTGHAGCRLTASPTDRGCRASAPTTIFHFVLLLYAYMITP